MIDRDMHGVVGGIPKSIYLRSARDVVLVVSTAASPYLVALHCKIWRLAPIGPFFGSFFIIFDMI